MYGIWDGSKVIGTFVAPMTVRSNQPVFVSDTLSLSRKIMRRTAQRWEIETAIKPETREANTLMVDLITKGYSEIVEVLMPQNSGVLQQRAGGAEVRASGGQGSSQITITPPGGLVPMGTFIRFDNHPKVYITTTDVAAGNTVGIFPALRVAVVGGVGVGTIMTYMDDVIANMRYDTDVVSGMSYTDGILMDPGTIKLVEAL